jgi:biotin carboxyl carrier protein
LAAREVVSSASLVTDGRWSLGAVTAPRVGTVVRWEVENGQMIRTDETAEDVEPVE